MSTPQLPWERNNAFNRQCKALHAQARKEGKSRTAFREAGTGLIDVRMRLAALNGPHNLTSAEWVAETRRLKRLRMSLLFARELNR